MSTMPTLVILAGGLAMRLYPVTKTIPKAMLPVAGRPFIEHQLELLKKNGIEKVVICSGYLSRQIEDYIGNGKWFGLTINFSVEKEKLLGTGGAVKNALHLLGETFFVLYGDSYLDIDYKSVYDFFLSQNKEGLMTVIKNNDRWDKSNIVFSNNNIIKYDKVYSTGEMEYIDYGLSLLKKSAFKETGEKHVFDLAEVFQSLIQKKQMLGYEIKTRFYEIGSVQGLAETELYIQGKLKENREP